MLVVTRYRVTPAETDAFLIEARAALEVLAARPGCLAVRVCHALDDGDLWLMHSEWESVGTYRRALSSAEVKMHAVPLMYRCIDEPSAFEVRLESADRGTPLYREGDLADGR